MLDIHKIFTRFIDFDLQKMGFYDAIKLLDELFASHYISSLISQSRLMY